MGIREFAKNMNKSQESVVQSDGTLTDDKQLLSLRRQKRLMDEREEKERLRAELKRRALADDRKTFSGSYGEKGKTILSKLPKDKSKRFMSAKSTIYS